ncbi:BlaI/MecI/CopY family transcriptional regulator [Candidatus Sumerlaeota bacterium]
MEPFTPGELEVMQVLWKHGELKPAEIQQRFPRDIRNAALRSALLVLLEKGHLERRKVGKAYFYQAKTPRERSFKAMTRRLAEVFCGGSSSALIAHLIESEDLSPDDVRELRRLASNKTQADATTQQAGETARGPRRKGESK